MRPKHTSKLKTLDIVLVFILMICSSYAQNKQESYFITTETQLKDSTYNRTINTFYQQGSNGFFKGQKNVKIFYKIFIQNDASNSPAIVISSGRTEAAIKYKELIFDLYNNGYSVYIFDHRGQGQSDRMTDDPDMGYVEDFQFYIDDMQSFYISYLKPKDHSKYFLLAHSMGGAIGMTYLEQHPNDFDAAAFSSPMLGLKAGTCSGAKLLKPKTPTYGLGQGKYSEEDEVFKNNPLTTSLIRFERMVDAFNVLPTARLGGASYQWVVESCDQFKYLFDNIELINTPFLIFSAEKEKIVSSKSHKQFVKNALAKNKDCILYEIKGAKHELLIESDLSRTKTLKLMLSFFSKYNED